jgi:Flp pilus assembly protein CpaB
LITATSTRNHRQGAVSASTVFALALALVAGLIFAWLAKILLLDRKKTPVVIEPTVPLTVAAANIPDHTQIQPTHVKIIKIPQGEFDRIVPLNRRPQLLVGNQPVGRIAKNPIRAEEPFFEDRFEPLECPELVSDKLHEGKRAVIVEVSTRDGGVQVGDWVDVYATLGNDAFGPGGNGTALIARNSLVLARSGRTQRWCSPPGTPACRTRPYTLEVTPYRFALIELAKTLGAQFTLAVTQKPVEGLPASTETEINEPPADRVTTSDLARLFGIGDPQQAGPGPWEIERYVGLQRIGTTSFPGYTGRLTAPTVQPVSQPPSPPVGPGRSPSPGGVRPAGMGNLPGPTLPPVVRPLSQTTPAIPSSGTLSTAVSSAAHNHGFRPVVQTGDATAAKPTSPTLPLVARTFNRVGPSTVPTFNPSTAVVSAAHNHGFRPVSGVRGDAPTILDCKGRDKDTAA